MIKSIFKRFIKHYYAKIKTEEELFRYQEEKARLMETVRNHFCAFPDNKKLLFFAHEIRPLGASILLNNLASYFVNNGYKIVVITNPGCEIDMDLVSSLTSEVLVLNLRDDKDWDQFILSEIAANGVKKCLANTVISGRYIRMIKDQGFYVVTLIHEMAASIRILKAEKLVKDIGEYADKIVFPTDKAKEQFEEIASVSLKDKCIILTQGIYNRVEAQTLSRKRAKRFLNESFGIPENSKVLIGIGSINFGKGVDLLIPVLLELQKHNVTYSDNTEYHVIWLGNADDTAFYEWLSVEIHNSGIENYWHWAGFVKDKALYYDIMYAADVFVLPSREDTYPSVALDAASIALPIAAFKNSGGGACVAAEQHGFLAKSADIVDYSLLIEKLISCNDKLKLKCNEYAAKTLADHDFTAYCKEIESFLI